MNLNEFYLFCVWMYVLKYVCMHTCNCVCWGGGAGPWLTVESYESVSTSPTSSNGLQACAFLPAFYVDVGPGD